MAKKSCPIFYSEFYIQIRQDCSTYCMLNKPVSNSSKKKPFKDRLIFNHVQPYPKRLYFYHVFGHVYIFSGIIKLISQPRPVFLLLLPFLQIRVQIVERIRIWPTSCPATKALPPPPSSIVATKVFQIFYLVLQKRVFFSGQALSPPPPPLLVTGPINKDWFFCGFPKKW